MLVEQSLLALPLLLADDGGGGRGSTGGRARRRRGRSGAGAGERLRGGARGELAVQLLEIEAHLLVGLHGLAAAPLVELELSARELSLDARHAVLLLLVAALPLLGGELLVDAYDVLDRLGALTEVERRLGLGLVEARWRAADDDGGARIAAERLLQDARELGVAIGHVGLGIGQRGDHVAQSRERLVDVLGLLEYAALGARLAHLLRAGQVDQVELAAQLLLRLLVLLLDVDEKDRVGSRAVLVHVGDGYVPVGLAVLDALEDLVGRGDEALRGALHVRHAILVLVHGQVGLGDVEQVAYLVQVDLEVADLDLELDARVHRVDVREYVLDDARYDALELLARQHALHRVRLARRRLTVGEYGAVVAGEDVVDDLLGGGRVHALLARVRLEHAIEGVHLAAHDARVVGVFGKLDHLLGAGRLLALVERPEAAHHPDVALVGHRDNQKHALSSLTHSRTHARTTTTRKQVERRRRREGGEIHAIRCNIELVAALSHSFSHSLSLSFRLNARFRL